VSKATAPEGVFVLFPRRRDDAIPLARIDNRLQSRACFRWLRLRRARKLLLSEGPCVFLLASLVLGTLSLDLKTKQFVLQPHSFQLLGLHLPLLIAVRKRAEGRTPALGLGGPGADDD
jgi:hypothetical protein